MTENFTMTIAGESVAGSSVFDVLNPANKVVLGQAPNCTEAELQQAIMAAQEALVSWRKTTVEERRGLMQAIAGKIAENAQALARWLTAEQGKPFESAMTDVLGGARWLAETSKWIFERRSLKTPMSAITLRAMSQ